MTQKMIDLYAIEPTQNVSDHPYDSNARKIIDGLDRDGCYILDCGAGYKADFYRNVVQMDVASYPNVDILAVNQELPFVDCSFDAVISLDVLEHVDDPFTSAREIARVLKPGGLLYVDLPFLQAEHGYPHHYFNSTRRGMLKLFAGLLEVERHYVPMSGHPIFTLTQILDIYAAHLREPQKTRFEQLTVKDILAKSPIEWLPDPIVQELPENARWLIASTTQAFFRKPE